MFARNTMEEAGAAGSEGVRRAGRAALVLLQVLLRRSHTHAKLLDTVHHQLPKVHSMTLSGRYRHIEIVRLEGPNYTTCNI